MQIERVTVPIQVVRTCRSDATRRFGLWLVDDESRQRRVAADESRFRLERSKPFAECDDVITVNGDASERAAEGSANRPAGDERTRRRNVLQLGRDESLQIPGVNVESEMLVCLATTSGTARVVDWAAFNATRNRWKLSVVSNASIPFNVRLPMRGCSTINAFLSVPLLRIS